MTRAAKAERLQLAVEAGAEITAALAGDDAPTVIVRRVAQALDTWECDLYEYDPQSRTLTAAAVWAQELTEEDLAWVGTTVSLDDRPGYVPIIEGGECVTSCIDDAGLDPADRSAMLEWGETATLAVPLAFHDRGVVGCLTLIEKREGRRFTDEDRELVRLLAGPAAVAIRNARLFRLQQEQNRHLASLLDTSRSITAAVTLEDSLTSICRTAAATLQTEECVVYEHDADRDALAYRAFYGDHGPPQDMDGGGVYPLDDYPTDREILRRGEVVQETLSDASLAADVRASMERWGEKACLNVPLVVEEERLGLLVLIETERERTFGAAEIQLAQALGEQAATAIRHARLYRRRERQNRRLRALLETSRVLVSSLDVDAVLGQVRRAAGDLFGAGGVDVTLLLRGDEGYVLFEPGRRSAASSEAAVELDELRRRAVDEGTPALSAGDGGSRAVVPFVMGDAVEGLLDIRAGERSVFSDDALELVQILASQAASALAGAGFYRELERQAITDGLTGLYNHRYVHERLNQEIARAQRYGLPLSLLMIDIDDFKSFNDRYGHPTGDLVLSEVGRILSTHIRVGIDIAARYGGEEFVIVLPNTARDGAQVVGARLARELSSLPGAPPPHEEGAFGVSEHIRISVAESELPGVGGDTRVTVSIGVACYPGAAAGPGELVRNADKALYLAKRLGKNRVEVFDD